MTDPMDALFANVDKMFDGVKKSMDDVMKDLDTNIANMHIQTTKSVTQVKQSAKDIEKQAEALQVLRDSLIGKKGLMVEFSIRNPTGWQSFKELIGLWKRKRVGVITTPPWATRMNFECEVEEPDGARHTVHVLNVTAIGPLDALARGI
jgi:hypothetical protein